MRLRKLDVTIYITLKWWYNICNKVIVFEGMIMNNYSKVNVSNEGRKCRT